MIKGLAKSFNYNKMEIMSIILVFVLGLFFGSLVNAVSYRLETEEDFVFSRSRCPKCSHTLSLKDLIPLLSFALLKGKCRYCRKPISWKYPLIEIITGLVFLSLYFKVASDNYFAYLETGVVFLIFVVLEIIFIYDFKNYLIPDNAVIIAVVFAFIYRAAFSIDRAINVFNQDFFYSIITAVFLWLIFWSVSFLSKEKLLGFGDSGLAFFNGFFLGWPMALISLFSTFFIGAIIGLGLIAFGRKKLNSQLALGPLMVLGIYLIFLFGEDIDGFLNRFLTIPF